MSDYVKHASTAVASTNQISVALTPAAAGNRLVAVAGTLAFDYFDSWPFTISSTPVLTWPQRYENSTVLGTDLTALIAWDEVTASTALHTVTVDIKAAGRSLNMFLWLWELTPCDYIDSHDSINASGTTQPHAAPGFTSGGLYQHIAAMISRSNRDFVVPIPGGWTQRVATDGDGFHRRRVFHDFKTDFTATEVVNIDSIISQTSQGLVLIYGAAAPAGPTEDSVIDPPDEQEGTPWVYDLTQHFTSSGGALVFDQLTGAPTGIAIAGQNLTCDGTTPAGAYQDITVRVSDDNGNIISSPFGFTVSAIPEGTITTEPLKDGNGTLLLGLTDGVLTVEADDAASAELVRFANVDQLPNGRVTVQSASLTTGSFVFVHVRWPQSANKERHCGYYQVA